MDSASAKESRPQPAIISASRRTDLPAWFMTPFMEWIRQGRVEVRNPFRPSQIRTVLLAPPHARAIVFWTRMPLPILPHVRELESRGLPFVVHVTLTGLGPPLENSPFTEEQRLDALQRLADAVGPQRVWWRYDPIVVSEKLGADHHLRTFERLLDKVAPCTDRVTISLLDPYVKTRRHLSTVAGAIGPICYTTGGDAPTQHLLSRLASMATQHGLSVFSCCEPAVDSATGIQPGSCIDAVSLNHLFGLDLPVAKDPGQRPACGCAASVDIGTNNTCLSRCLYCYATTRHVLDQTEVPTTLTRR